MHLAQLIFIGGIICILCAGGFAYDALAQAAGVGTPSGGAAPQSTLDTQAFLSNLYRWLLGGVGIAALLMIVWGGIQYMVSGTNITSVGSAKQKIWNALYGIVLAAASVLMLRVINPDLVTHGFNLKKIIDDATSGIRPGTDGTRPSTGSTRPSTDATRPGGAGAPPAARRLALPGKLRKRFLQMVTAAEANPAGMSAHVTVLRQRQIANRCRSAKTGVPRQARVRAIQMWGSTRS